MTIERLREIYDEAETELYSGELGWGHIGVGDLIEWVEWKETTDAEWKDIRNFDVYSIQNLFEDWVKGPRP